MWISKWQSLSSIEVISHVILFFELDVITQNWEIETRTWCKAHELVEYTGRKRLLTSAVR